MSSSTSVVLEAPTPPELALIPTLPAIMMKVAVSWADSVTLPPASTVAAWST